MAAASKAPGGLRRVLFVRAPADLVSLLNEELRRRRKAAPGHVISQADLVRELLHEQLQARGLLAPKAGAR